MQSSDDRLAEAMLDASRTLVGLAARSLASAADDVTLPQFRTLVVLDTRGPQSGAALAEELGIGASSVTRMCDRLEAKGLARRDPGPDRRTLEIAVTAAGARLVAKVTDDRRRHLAELVRSVPREHRALLADALEAMARLGGERAGDEDPAWAVGWDR
jgi:DNA-binding MarR family transcriptional regulator